MILKSDFTDYYDLYFDDSGPVFNRISKNTGPNKKQQFEILKSHGFLVPPHGTVGEILRSEFEDCPIDAVVAYTDINAHCGDGKRVFVRGMLKSNPDMGSPGGDRFWRERELFCSAFIGSYPKTCTGGSSSIRRLQIGPHVFWIEYTSKESWMSNVGDGDIAVIGVEQDAGYHSIRLPLFAIDFVLGKEMYAVDLNVSPGIRGSGVEKYIKPYEVLEALEQSYRDRVWVQPT